LGLGIGVLALWLDGQLPTSTWDAEAFYRLAPAVPGAQPRKHPFYDAFYPPNTWLPNAACWLSYFGLMFLVLRWWKDVEETRPARFSVMALAATCFWAFLLLFLLPTSRERQIGFTTMALTSVIVQLCSPRRRPLPPPRSKPVRLRLAG
ncbi:MAG: hypothetical protein NZO58_09290, partial [Gemmataceae bacterium]|nr:hypothetical protein [Gemmataceae bacterium]